MQALSDKKKKKMLRPALPLAAALAALAVLLSAVATADELSAGDPSSDFGGAGSPKRQFLIAPRIGRSGSAPAAIWSALEEGAWLAPGKVQAHRGYPQPTRSSLLFLIGNQRALRPRSGGLLPQARIGRRAAPMGLLPQPRVGRSAEPATADGADGEQEVALAASVSDSSAMSEALESLLG